MIKGELFDVDNDESLGVIGDFAFEHRGVRYYIGDIVEAKIYSFNVGSRVIVRRNNKGDCFISGYKSDSETEYCRQSVTIKKIMPYNKLQNGKRYDYAIAHIENININKRII
jgi:hypothetical protein